MLSVTAIVVVLLLAGCGGASSGAGKDSGVPAVDSGGQADSGGVEPADAGSYPPLKPAVIPIDGQVLVPVSLDGNPGPFYVVVDTGAVRTAIETTLLRNVENGVGIATIDFGGGIVFPDYEVLAADLARAEDHIGVPIHGLVGQDLFQKLYFGLDYKTSSAVVALSAPEDPPPGYSASERIVVSYDVNESLGIPLLDARIGAKTARLIADTGSGVTILTESFVEPQVLDMGLSGYVWYTSYGSDPATIVRVPSLEIGGAVAKNSWAVVVPDEHHLKPVFDAIGVEVDGFLGYPFFRQFFTVVDAARERWEFHPYVELPHVPAGEWDRVGIEIARQEADIVVDMVFLPSDAQSKGIAPGDALRSIDGENVQGEGLDDLRLKLRGTPGEIRSLVLSADGVERQVVVAVDRLLE